MKLYFRNLITRLLWLQVKRLRAKHNPVVIAIAGSVGKSGTKKAIATVLSEQMKVAWQEGNYNDIISVPLVFFNQKMPSLYNPLSWLWLFLQTERQIQGVYKPQAVVLELGTDKPGDMNDFKQYLRVDYGVLTAIQPEHMENFTDLDAVAEEELVIAEICDQLIVDKDAVDKKYLKNLVNIMAYSQGMSDCRVTPGLLTKNLARKVRLTLKTSHTFDLESRILPKKNLNALAAATLIANKLELKPEEIKRGLANIEPMSGRFTVLDGLRGSKLLDDTYNSSPEAVKSALDLLYEIKAQHKIAILGQMNELGEHSQRLHEQVGKHCDPKQLDIVITIGKDANEFLASVAESRGCKVMRCPSPDHAADVAQRLIQKDTVILIKGSQNGVFAEEAVKELLANSSDAKKLVRQTRKWLKTKQRCFADLDD